MWGAFHQLRMSQLFVTRWKALIQDSVGPAACMPNFFPEHYCDHLWVQVELEKHLRIKSAHKVNENLKKKVMKSVIHNEDVQFHWAIVASDWERRGGCTSIRTSCGLVCDHPRFSLCQFVDGAA